MRLGEIRNILREVVNDSDQIAIEHEPLFGGQAQLVKNYGSLISALDILAEQNWNDVGYSQIEEIKKEYGSEVLKVQLPQEQFNQLNSYLSSLNAKLPLYLSILDTMVDDQDEKTLNIKLPDSISSLNDLNSTNKKLEDLFKKFNLSGEFKFKGFDKGTSWYEVLVTSEVLYRYVIACLGVALLIVQFKKTYYESEQAKLNYLATLKENDKPKEVEQKKHSDRYIDVSLEEKVKKIVHEIEETNGKTFPELKSNLVLATKDLVEHLNDGVEFHLSLNPPEYAQEKGAQIVIDYKSMPKLGVKEKPKQIEDRIETVDEKEKNDK